MKSRRYRARARFHLMYHRTFFRTAKSASRTGSSLRSGAIRQTPQRWSATPTVAEDGGISRVSPLDRLPCDVEHLKAARRLRQDWERGSGAMSGGGDAGKVDSSSGDRDGGTVGQLEARRRYQDAVEAVGPRLCGYLLPVVLAGWTVAQMVTKHGGNPMALQGRVMAALDRLADHFGGMPQTRLGRASA